MSNRWADTEGTQEVESIAKKLRKQWGTLKKHSVKVCGWRGEASVLVAVGHVRTGVWEHCWASASCSVC